MTFSLLFNIFPIKSVQTGNLNLCASFNGSCLWSKSLHASIKLRPSFFFGNTLQQCAKACRIRGIVTAATVVSSGTVVLYVKAVCIWAPAGIGFIYKVMIECFFFLFFFFYHNQAEKNTVRKKNWLKIILTLYFLNLAVGQEYDPPEVNVIYSLTTFESGWR